MSELSEITVRKVTEVLLRIRFPPMEWIQAPVSKQEKNGFVTKTKSTDDYIVKHIARHFLIAADRCNQHRDEMSSATDHMK